MSKNNNLHSAKKAKNDEFYTRIDDVEKELKALTHSADNLQPAAVSFTFHEWLHLFCFHFSHTSFSAIYRRFYLYLIVIITLKQQNATLFCIPINPLKI